jgi:hypothetical protein
MESSYFSYMRRFQKLEDTEPLINSVTHLTFRNVYRPESNNINLESWRGKSIFQDSIFRWITSHRYLKLLNRPSKFAAGFADKFNALLLRLTFHSAGQHIPASYRIRNVHYCAQYSQPPFGLSLLILPSNSQWGRTSESRSTYDPYFDAEQHSPHPHALLFMSSILPATPQSPVTLSDQNAVCIFHMPLACYRVPSTSIYFNSLTIFGKVQIIQFLGI